MHRGLGGALVKVISVPGIVPRSEIGVDHHLWAINRQRGREGSLALPFHVVAARAQVVKQQDLGARRGGQLTPSR